MPSNAIAELHDELERVNSVIYRLENKLGPLQEQRGALVISINVLSEREGKPCPLGRLRAPGPSSSDYSALRNSDAIERLLRESKGPLRLGDIVRGLNDRNKAMSNGAVRVALSVERGKRFESAGRGIWKLNAELDHARPSV